MRLARAIDRFLDWRQLERDSPPSSIETYWRILKRLRDDWPNAGVHEFNGRDGLAKVRLTYARHWGHTSASTRANVVSIMHSFFRYLETEDMIEDDQVRKLRRPPTRKPDIQRPRNEDLMALRAAATVWEKPAILLLEGVGLRSAEVCRARWRDVDLEHSRIRVLRKGQKRQTLPLLPDVADELAACKAVLQPGPDWHLYTVRSKKWIGHEHKAETIRDPTEQAPRNSLWYLVDRVCERANVRHLGPHRLRHGFATRLREQGVALDVIQMLLGHARPDTTQRYMDELQADQVERELRQSLPGLYTTIPEDNVTANTGGSSDRPQYSFRPDDESSTDSLKDPGGVSGDSDA